MNTDSPSFASLSLQELADRLTASEARHDAQLKAVENRCQAAESRYQGSEHRFRVLCGVLLGAITITTVLPFLSPAAAQGYGVTLTSLATRVTALETWRTTATSQINTLDTDLGVVETKTASMSVVAANDATNTSAQPTVRFSNVNVQIVSGSGDTFGTTNGRGNLILGYNELRATGNDRTGSHNLVIGMGNNYTSVAFGGMVVGINNTINNNFATISGGIYNTSSGNTSAVSGGAFNTARGESSTVSGGVNRTASATYQWVAGSTGNSGRGGSGGGNSTLGGNGDGPPKGGL